MISRIAPISWSKSVQIIGSPSLGGFFRKPGATRAAMQITLFGRSAELLASRCARDVANATRQRGNNGIEVLNHF